MQNNDRKSYIVFLLQRSKTSQKKRVEKIKKFAFYGRLLKQFINKQIYLNSLLEEFRIKNSTIHDESFHVDKFSVEKIRKKD